MSMTIFVSVKLQRAFNVAYSPMTMSSAIVLLANNTIRASKLIQRILKEIFNLKKIWLCQSILIHGMRVLCYNILKKL